MTAVKAVLKAFLGLFVDDGSVILALIGWVVGAVVLLRAGILAPDAAAVVMAAGIGAVLAENVRRTARAFSAKRPGG